MKCSPAGFLQYFAFTVTHLEIGSSLLCAKPLPFYQPPSESESHLSLWTGFIFIFFCKPFVQQQHEAFHTSQASRRIVLVLGGNCWRQVQKYIVNAQSLKLHHYVWFLFINFFKFKFFFCTLPRSPLEILKKKKKKTWIPQSETWMPCHLLVLMGVCPLCFMWFVHMNHSGQTPIKHRQCSHLQEEFRVCHTSICWQMKWKQRNTQLGLQWRLSCATSWLPPHLWNTRADVMN